MLVILGSVGEAAHLVRTLALPGTTCFQLDLYPAERLSEELGDSASVVTRPDLWDLPAEFASAIYLPQKGGERELKIDMVEQAWHVLRPGAPLLIWSPYDTDPFFPNLLRKIFGRASIYNLERSTVFACVKAGDRPRRRHEVTFQARLAGGPSCRFLSRPGTFSYGRFDDGARALLESVDLVPGQRVLDLGCGCGTNGVFAWQRVGPTGHVTFVDSSVRAIALAQLNAQANGVASFDAFATAAVQGPPEASYDVVLANPPYFAQESIAQLFIARGQAMLKPGGHFWLVTRQPRMIEAMLLETFAEVEAGERRGYTIFKAC